MKIIGLITEYNPFHSGHLYQLEKSKEELGADYCIALMSGSFVQRGAPAVYDKYIRTSMALDAGADLVLEMPVAFSTASAKEFAAYAVSVFTLLGAVDTVSFGSECGSLFHLSQIAAFLLNEPPEYSHLLKQYLKEGMTYPEARSTALSGFFKPECLEILKSPNNILGIEYAKAALLQNSHLTLHTIKREGQGYHDSTASGGLSSATAIRRVLRENAASPLLKEMVPPYVWKVMEKEIPLFLDDFSALLNYRILTGQNAVPMESIADMTDELAARVRKNALSFDTFENRVAALKSRQLTYTRVSRALLHLLLGLQEKDMDMFKESGYASYTRILGFRKSAAPLLSSLKANTSIPLISKLADAKKYLSETGDRLLSQEINASHLYSYVKAEKGGIFKNEYTQPIIIK